MQSKIKITPLQLSTEKTGKIRDLSDSETTGVVGSSEASKELLAGSRFYFEAQDRVRQRLILEISGLSVNP